MKLLKKLIFIILSLIVVATIALWVLTKTIKPETVKQFINTKLTAITHKPSQINGSMSWQLFPRPGIKATDIKVGNEQQDKDYSFTIGSLLLNLKITPLLHGNFVFSDIKVDKLNLVANRDKLPQKKAIAATAEKQPVSKAKSTEKFAIERLMVTHSQLLIKQQKSELKVTDLQLGIEQFNLLDRPFPIQLKAKISNTQENNNLSLILNYKGKLGWSSAQQSNALKQLNMTGLLSGEKIKFNQFNIKKISANIKTENNELILNPLTLSLYDGESVGDLHYQLDKQLIDINQTATGLNSKTLFNQLLGFDIVSGTMDYSIHAKVPANNPALENISANGRLTIKEGSIIGVDLELLVNETSDKLGVLLQGPKLTLAAGLNLLQFSPGVFSQGSTPFKLATIQFHLNNANLVTDSLLLQNDKMQVQGNGQLNLINYDIDGRLQASVTAANENATSIKVQQLLGGNYPITISGNLKHPIVLPDLKIIDKILGNVLIKKVLDKPVKDIEKQIKSLFH